MNSVPFFVEEDILFLRKSRGDGDLSTEEVLARHEKILQETAMQVLGHKIDDKNIYREIISGGEEELENRPQFLKVLKRLEDGNIRHVFVYDLQRLSRQGIYGAGDIINAFKYTDTKIATPNKIYDLSNKYDKKFVEMEMLQGNEYLEYTKTILQNGLKQSLREGKYIGSEPPYGYDKEKLKKEKGYKLIINEEEAEIVKMIFEIYIEELGANQLANYLNKLGYKPRKNDFFTPDYVREVLKNPTYYGNLVWQKRKTIRVLENGKVKKKVVTNKNPILVKGIHEPLITKEQFDIAQQKMKSHNSSKVPRTSEIKNPLASLIKCKQCGQAMVRKPYYSNKRKGEKRTFDFDKLELIAILQEHKKESGLSLSKIAEQLNVTKGKVDGWLSPNPNRVYFSKCFAENWFKLKEALNIKTTKFDKAITTFEKTTNNPPSLVCTTPNCSNVSSYLHLVETRVLDALKHELSGIKYFVDNYEAEIIKEANNNKKALEKVEAKINILNKELKNNRRAYNREEYSFDEYQETKNEIEADLKELNSIKENLLNSSQEDKIVKYKKAIPKIENCVKKYNTLSINEKNELLKGIIKKIEYNRTSGGRWNEEGQDNFEIKIELNI